MIGLKFAIGIPAAATALSAIYEAAVNPLIRHIGEDIVFASAVLAALAIMWKMALKPALAIARRSGHAIALLLALEQKLDSIEERLERGEERFDRIDDALDRLTGRTDA